MNNKNQQKHYLEKLSKTIITESELDLTTTDFTTSVMTKIDALHTSKIVYKPLLSKKMLLFGIVVFLVLPIVLFLGLNVEESPMVNMVDFRALYTKTALLFSGVHIPVSFTYGILFLGLMFGIQIPFLKYRFNKRFEV